VLLVTHDVEEAIRLADRVLVLEHGRIVYDVPVTLSRPRSSAFAPFHDLRRALLIALGVDVLSDEPAEVIAGNV
jgi:sulfonate transport system ATP-binding protein